MALCVVFLFLTCCLRVIKDNVVVIDYVISKDVGFGLSSLINSTTKIVTPSTLTPTTFKPTGEVNFTAPALKNIHHRVTDKVPVGNTTQRRNVCTKDENRLGK